MPERISWIDFAKGFVMILVVLGHALDEDYALYTCIYIFHMPFFFISAGYLLNLNKWGGSNNFKKFALKLFKRLLVPYYLANILFFPIWFIICYKLEFLTYFGYWDKATPFTAGLAIFIGNGNGVRVLLAQLWFLPALFFAEIIFIKLWNRFAKNSAEIFVLTIVLVAYAGFLLSRFGYFPFGLNVALVSQIFLLAGILIRRYKIIDKMNLIIFGGISFILMFAFLFNRRAEISWAIFGEPLLFLAGGIAGSLIVMKLSVLMTDGKFFSLISDCGRQSMMILVLHLPIIELLLNVFVKNNFASPAEIYNTPICMFMLMTSGVLIPLFIAKKFGKLHVLKYFCS